MADTYTVERNTTIEAPADRVYAQIVDLRNWTAWSPWEGLDPNMERVYSGADSGVGAATAWSGNRKAGEGNMEITEAVEPSTVKIALEFIKPFKSRNTTTFNLKPQGEATEVTWTMVGPSTFMTRVMGIFKSMDKMIGPDFDGFIDDAIGCYDLAVLEEKGGIVDFIVGTRPGPGVYVFAVHDDPQQHLYLKYGKLGDGPLYSFYTPYHLCHFEVPNSAARAVLFHDPTIEPSYGPQVDVITIAKTDLPADTILDGLGGFHTFGLCERHDITRSDRLLPMGLAEGCTLIRDVSKDQALTYDDVSVPPGRLVDKLRAEQDKLFPQPVLTAANLS